MIISAMNLAIEEKKIEAFQKLKKPKENLKYDLSRWINNWGCVGKQIITPKHDQYESCVMVPLS